MVSSCPVVPAGDAIPRTEPPEQEDQQRTLEGMGVGRSVEVTACSLKHLPGIPL